MFSVGGAITAPELHRAAMDQLMKQLILGGMPSQVADDVITPKEFDDNTGEPTNEVRIPKIYQESMDKLIATMPLPLNVYCGAVGTSKVDRELDDIPMFGHKAKAPSLQAEERDKYIAVHQSKIVKHEINIKRAENDLKHWDKQVREIRS